MSSTALDSADRRRRRRARGGLSLPARAAHLLVLTSFAIAQPLYDLLGDNPEFFAVRGSSSWEIVIFALLLTFLLPPALVAAEAAVGAADLRASRILHLVFVAGLVALIALQVIKRTGATGVAALVAAAAVAAVAAVLYGTTRAVPAILSVLTPAPILFIVLFLFSSDVAKLVRPAEAAVHTQAVSARTPVVLIVFDELSTVSLMDARQRVDARRYPHFADLARHSTWFRSATSAHPHSEHAVPAILTGRLPDRDRLPIYADHPRNVFTLLGGSYELSVLETLTHLCPPTLCRKQPAPAASTPAETAHVEDESASLASDAGIVYLHVLLPDPYEARLPPISDTWGDFGGSEDNDEVETTRNGAVPRQACGRKVCLFTRRVAASRRPTLYFLHSLLPHVPWLYLPSGQRYGNNIRQIPGIDDAEWSEDEWLTVQGYQRYLLQLAYTDRALGLILSRLRSSGLFDRALVVLAADHGVSFRPGEPRRLVTDANFDEIAFVPLFVKLPRQRRPRVIDSPARTIDILPTIADALGVRLPWPVDGRSLLAQGPRNRTISLFAKSGQTLHFDLATLRDRRTETLRRQVELFGTGRLERVYRIGPHAELLGRVVSSLRTRPSEDTRVALDGRSLLDAVDPKAELVPAYVTGSVPLPDQELAVALNGTIVATTRTYTTFGETRFAAMVPAEALRRGRNEVGVYAVREDTGGIVLEELTESSTSFALVSAGGREQIRSSRGDTIPVERRALRGNVSATIRQDTAFFAGWAVQPDVRRPASSVIVFVDGRSVYSGDASNFKRPDIARRYDVEEAGFTFEFARSLVPPQGAAKSVRVFALGAGVATELPYAPGYPWRRG